MIMPTKKNNADTLTMARKTWLVVLKKVVATVCCLGNVDLRNLDNIDMTI